jgi:hypothetical protein
MNQGVLRRSRKHFVRTLLSLAVAARVLKAQQRLSESTGGSGARSESTIPAHTDLLSGVGSQFQVTDLNGDGSLDIVESGLKHTFIFWNRMHPSHSNGDRSSSQIPRQPNRWIKLDPPKHRFVVLDLCCCLIGHRHAQNSGLTWKDHVTGSGSLLPFVQERASVVCSSSG